MEDAIRDAHDKNLISLHKEDLIVELLKNPLNRSKITVALAHSTIDRRFQALDFLDLAIMYKESMN